MHFYKCFACGASGNAFRFAMEYHKMAFPEALRFLAERAGIELAPWQPVHDAGGSAPEGFQPGASRQQLIAANEIALQYYRSVLAHPQAGAAAREAIQKRGITPQFAEMFGLGAAPDSWDALMSFARKRGVDVNVLRESGLIRSRASGDGARDTFVNRLMFPICDQLGRPVAFGGRVLNPEDVPKYLNSPESPVFSKSSTLFGLHLARRAITERNCAIVTEGYTDVMAMHQSGFTNTVATLGTALTNQHAGTLQRLCDTVVLLFDGDVAGQKAADRAVEIFFAEPIDVKICILPDACDPDDFLRLPNGRLELQSLLDVAESALSFLVRRFKGEIDRVETVSGRQKALDALLARLADLGFDRMSGLRKRLILPSLAHMLGVSIQDVETRMPRRRARPAASYAGAISHVVEGEGLVIGERADRVVPRDRVAAERDLLSILIFEPSVGRMPVEIDGYRLPFAEAFLPESFADGLCRRVYEAAHAYLEANVMFTAAALEASASSEAAAKAIYDLYFRGRALCCDDDQIVPVKLRDAAAAFEQVCRRGEVRHAIREIREGARTEPQVNASAAPAFVQVLEARRSLGEDRAAMPRGVRHT